MLRRFINKLGSTKKSAGLEVIFLAEGKTIINLLGLSVNKNIVNANIQVKGIENIQDLKKSLDIQVPVAVAVNGKGILHKRISQNLPEDDNSLLQLVLPNARSQDFYIQKVEIEGGFFISVIRKSNIDSLVSELISLGYYPVSISLGPFIISLLVPVLGDIQASFAFSGHEVSFKEGRILDYHQIEGGSKGEIEIGGQKIEDDFLLCYAAAFQLLIGTNEESNLPVEEVQNAAEEFKQKKIFTVLGWGSLVFFLLVLLTNFLLFDKFSSENKLLIIKEGYSTGVMVELLDLEKKVADKEEFLKTAGWLTLSKNSFYSDRIAKVVPASVKLTELSVNPLDEKVSRIEKKLSFSNRKIKLTGTCNTPTDLNPWIKKLKDMDWIELVEMVNYSFDNREKTGVFYILITVRE